MKFIEKTLKNTFNVTGIVNLHFFEFPADFYTQKDSHPFYELVFVSTGKLSIISDTYSGTLEKGQMLIHTPNEVHALSCDENTSPTVVIIGFNCSGADLDKFSCIPTTLTANEIKTLAEVVKEGRHVFMPPYNVPTYDMKKKPVILFGAEQILKSKLECFFIGLLRHSLTEEDRDLDTKKTKIAINEILTYLEENFREKKITIDELAFIFNTNRATICSEFKAYTNTTIADYVNERKLQEAKKMLLFSKKTVTEISNELGYESIHYFTRFFTKKIGTSPLNFRKTHEEGKHYEDT